MAKIPAPLYVTGQPATIDGGFANLPLPIRNFDVLASKKKDVKNIGKIHNVQPSLFLIPMSFDLAVSKNNDNRVPSDSEAAESYRDLCNDQCGGGPFAAGIEEFYRDLTRRYPEIDKVPKRRLITVLGQRCVATQAITSSCRPTGHAPKKFDPLSSN